MNCLEKFMHDNPDAKPHEVVKDFCPSGFGIMDDPEGCEYKGGHECSLCWAREIPGTEPTITAEAVNHPKHYGREGAMECIDEMLLVFGTEATANFCLLNSWKYRYRAADKGGEEDLKKSDWYLAKYAELKGVTTVAP